MSGASRSLSSVAGGNETILVVEDDLTVRALLKKVLSRLGYQVLEASSGSEAFGLWSAHCSVIDLLVTDIVLPDGMTGFELAERLKQEQPRLPIIFATGFSDRKVDREAKTIPGAAYLPKPFTPQTLALLVRKQLDAHRLDQ
jgi:CheY-like chemotaxis protein